MSFENDLNNFKNQLVEYTRDFVLSNFDVSKSSDNGIIKNTAKSKNGVKQFIKNWNNGIEETSIDNDINKVISKLDNNIALVEEDFVENGFDFSLNKVDKEFLETVKANYRINLDKLFDIGSNVYQDVINAVNIAVFQDNFTIKDLKANLNEILPITLNKYALTYANTVNFQYFQEIENVASQHIPKDKIIYRYSGALKKTSRNFCKARVNNYYTKEEIDKWNKENWQGKIQGLNVFNARGGWNCTHQLRAVARKSLNKSQQKRINVYNVKGQKVDYKTYLKSKPKKKTK